MSTATPPSMRRSLHPPGSVRCGLRRSARTVKAEWTKLRTLPSTWRAVVMAFVISVGLGAILCSPRSNSGRR